MKAETQKMILSVLSSIAIALFGTRYMTTKYRSYKGRKAENAMLKASTTAVA